MLPGEFQRVDTEYSYSTAPPVGVLDRAFVLACVETVDGAPVRPGISLCDTATTSRIVATRETGAPIGLRAWPNPTSDEVVIEAPTPIQRWAIRDAVGRELQSERLGLAVPRVQLSLEPLPAGLYMVTCELQDGRRAYARVMRQ